jgi:hypothetical protein
MQMMLVSQRMVSGITTPRIKKDFALTTVSPNGFLAQPTGGCVQNILGAEGKLEAKLQEYNRKPWEFNTRSRLFQVECQPSYPLAFAQGLL